MVEGSRGTIRRRTCLIDIVVCRRTSRLQQIFHSKAWGRRHQCSSRKPASDRRLGNTRFDTLPLHADSILLGMTDVFHVPDLLSD